MMPARVEAKVKRLIRATSGAAYQGVGDNL